MKIIHISDLHYNSYPQSISDVNFKIFLGSINLFLNKSKKHPLKNNINLVKIIRNLSWDHLIISGDITHQTRNDFKNAKNIESFITDPDKITIVPGNHDKYLSYNKDNDYFFRYFGDYFNDTEIHYKEINEKWKIIGWDSAYINPWHLASGKVSQGTLKKTEHILNNSKNNTNFIIVNHYPIFFPEGFIIKDNHELINLKYMQDWIVKYPKIKLYLHGHIHKNWVIK